MSKNVWVEFIDYRRKSWLVMIQFDAQLVTIFQEYMKGLVGLERQVSNFGRAV